MNSEPKKFTMGRGDVMKKNITYLLLVTIIISIFGKQLGTHPIFLNREGAPRQ